MINVIWQQIGQRSCSYFSHGVFSCAYFSLTYDAIAIFDRLSKCKSPKAQYSLFANARFVLTKLGETRTKNQWCSARLVPYIIKWRLQKYLTVEKGFAVSDIDYFSFLKFCFKKKNPSIDR